MSSIFGSAADTRGSLPVLRRLDAYKDAIRRHLPALPEACLEAWPLLAHDVLAIHGFLDSLEGYSDVVAVDIGTFLGTSAYALSLHRRVARVISIDPNPRIADEVAKANVIGHLEDLDKLGDQRVLEAALVVLSSFPDEARKIEVTEGSLGESADISPRIDLRGLLGDAQVLAIVDGLHTAEGVASDLEGIFSASHNAIAVLDDCRYIWGPEVQSGVARFLRDRDGAVSFKLLADIGTAFAKSNLGFVYVSADERMPRAFAALQASHADFDALVLLRRNEELMRLSAQQREELLAARAMLRGMQHSRSWKITSPLRAVDAALRRHGG